MRPRATRRRLLDPHNTASAVWADAAYRSAANLALLGRRGLLPHLARGNASRARVRIAIEHVFAAQNCRLGLVINLLDLLRARYDYPELKRKVVELRGLWSADKGIAETPIRAFR